MNTHKSLFFSDAQPGQVSGLRGGARGFLPQSGPFVLEFDCSDSGGLHGFICLAWQRVVTKMGEEH